MQHDHLLNFDLLAPTPRAGQAGGGGGGVCGQHFRYNTAVFLIWILFDMQHDQHLKKLNLTS